MRLTRNIIKICFLIILALIFPVAVHQWWILRQSYRVRVARNANRKLKQSQRSSVSNSIKHRWYNIRAPIVTNSPHSTIHFKTITVKNLIRMLWAMVPILPTIHRPAFVCKDYDSFVYNKIVVEVCICLKILSICIMLKKTPNLCLIDMTLN